MTEREIMEQIKKLTTAERLAVVEKTLRSIREELEQIEKPVSDTDLKLKLAKPLKPCWQIMHQGEISPPLPPWMARTSMLRNEIWLINLDPTVGSDF